MEIITIIYLVVFLAASAYIIFKIKDIIKCLSWLFYWPKKLWNLINPIPEEAKSAKGYVQGIWFAVSLTILLSLIASLLLWKLPLPTNIYTYLLAYTAIASMIFPFCFGKRFLDTIEPGFQGVPLILGGRTKLWLFDEGLIWKPPKPIAGFIPVDIREKTYDLEGTYALSADNILVRVDFSFSTMIINPYASTWIENIKKSSIDLALREVRAFIRTVQSEDAPDTRDDLRKHIREYCAVEMEGKSLSEEDESISEEDESEDKRKGEKRPWGMVITRIFVTDIRLPGDLEAAYAQQKIDEALAKAKLIKLDALRDGIQAVKGDKLNGVSDRKIIDIVQTEYGTADRIIVDGSDPISRAAAILVSGKKELKEVVENEK